MGLYISFYGPVYIGRRATTAYLLSRLVGGGLMGMGWVRDAVLDVIQYVKNIDKAAEILRHEDAFFLTGIYTDTGNVDIKTDVLKYRAYRGFVKYIRGDSASWDPNLLVEAISLSASRALTLLQLNSILALMEYEVEEKSGTVRRAKDDRLPLAVDLVLGLGKSEVTWLVAAQQAMQLPLVPLTTSIARDQAKVAGWKDPEGYKAGLRELAQVIGVALINDRLAREYSRRYSITKWHYKRYDYYMEQMSDIQQGQAGFGELDWRLMADKYAPHGLCLYRSLGTLEEVELEGGGKAWRITIDDQSLTKHAKWLEEYLEKYSYPRELFESYYRFASDVSSGKLKGVTSPINSIKALWRGWVCALYSDLAEASREGDALRLLMRRPEGLPFNNRNIYLLVGSLAMHRQITHTYMHLAKLLSDEAKGAADREAATIRKGVFSQMATTLKTLCAPEGWEKYSDLLKTIPDGPAISMYEQLFHAPTIAAGMVYSALSSISFTLRLESEIPADPMRLLEEQLPGVASYVADPRFSESIDLLRRSARLPVGVLDRCYRQIEDMLEIQHLLKGPMSP
jgi:hypothetical protein